MNQLPMHDIVTGVLFANIITVALLYAFWRIKKNENDMKAVLLLIALCGVVLLFVYGSSTD